MEPATDSAAGSTAEALTTPPTESAEAPTAEAVTSTEATGISEMAVDASLCACAWKEAETPARAVQAATRTAAMDFFMMVFR